jgi:hypothetical protein
VRPETNQPPIHGPSSLKKLQQVIEEQGKIQEHQPTWRIDRLVTCCVAVMSKKFKHLNNIEHQYEVQFPILETRSI